jgi:hypothetical protein
MAEQELVDKETGLDILVPGMSQQQPRVETTPEQTRARITTSHAAREQQEQPLATRHLDPNYNPALAFESGVGPKVDKDRCKLRAGYMYYYGEREAFKGPAILYLTKEERKGQEHKLEVLGDEPVQMAAAAKPITASEDMSARERAEKIQALKLELDTLVAEHDHYLKGLENRETDTVKQAPINPEAESAVLKPDTPGDIAGPDFNPDAEDAKPAEEPKKRRGRPPGKVNKIKG